ncbi:hypothetical protein SAMN06265795_11140 [Noviherbaspirillum humi]|uniref:Uncharacterized protein n=1 Tax=Noviherbaspirillum humi TaxID=1688639 RepID=A0A239J0Q5_9BURK|nr:hypothetical protein [Noviherbaspirillum humi]SNS98853.1 hypothetical protein SAMN06265795_11140 [Noviherbaspirillum humi]
MTKQRTPDYDPTDFSKGNQEIAKPQTDVVPHPDEEQKKRAKEVLENFNGEGERRQSSDL